MKFLAVLALAVMLTGCAAKKRVNETPITFTTGNGCNPSVKIIAKTCTPINDHQWKCVGGYDIITAYCVQYDPKLSSKTTN